jgi:type II secretory ATPase GspE/PulE/Tfp pilus assembly ATPase PilB-like protein
VNVTHPDTVDAELDRLISKRASQDRRPDSDEQEELWKASVRRYNARKQEEIRAAWCEHHQGQAARLRATLEALIARHEEQAERYRGEGAS